MSGYGLFHIADIVFPLVFSCIFLLALGIIVVTLVKNVSEWSSNSRSPVLSVEARVVSKRSRFSQHRAHAGQDNTLAVPAGSTSYFATFQVESGDRMELRVSGREYGQLAEGDKGKLTFQGTRYRNFERRLF